MIKEAIGVGESIEEAKESAILQLGLNSTDDYDIEVLETPKKKTLGLFGGSPAKVRVTVEVAEPKTNAKKNKIFADSYRNERPP